MCICYRPILQTRTLCLYWSWSPCCPSIHQFWKRVKLCTHLFGSQKLSNFLLHLYFSIVIQSIQKFCLLIIHKCSGFRRRNSHRSKLWFVWSKASLWSLLDHWACTILSFCLDRVHMIWIFWHQLYSQRVEFTLRSKPWGTCYSQ